MAAPDDPCNCEQALDLTEALSRLLVHLSAGAERDKKFAQDVLDKWKVGESRDTIRAAPYQVWEEEEWDE
jgi:hypothetical protein